MASGLLLAGRLDEAQTMSETRTPESVRRILRYFVRNPDAADTYEGIVRWRLVEEAIHQTTEETEQALDWLLSRGFLSEVPIAGNAPVFRLNPTKRAEAEGFLRAAEQPRGDED